MQAKGILSKGADSVQPNVYCSLKEIKSAIGKPEILISPCDPDRTAMLGKVRTNWKNYSHNAPIPAEVISYVFIKGADAARPTTILAATRNLLTSDLAEGNNRWVGADERPVMDEAVAGLNRGKGQLVMADGSTHLSNDADLGPRGRITVPHVKSEGGNSVTEASASALGCCGGFIAVPITEVFVTEPGNHHTFIIDKSGSMSGDNRLNQAKNALLAALNKMKPTKKFYVFFFDSSSTGMEGGSRRAFKWEIDLVRPWIEEQAPGSRTDPRKAIRDAFERIKPDTIWILTDGRFNGSGGTTAVRNLITELNTNNLVRVNTVGFGRAPQYVDRNLGGIAIDNNGTYYFSRSGNRN